MAVSESIIKRDNYRDKHIQYIKKTNITEYDMKNAGLNILTEMGFISLKKRDELLLLPKLKRNIEIGMMLRKDLEMNKSLSEGFAEARRIFVNNNDLNNDNIFSIKKDAIFVINGEDNLNGEISDLIEFKRKGTYNSFIELSKKEHYYNYENDSLVVKGYGKEIALLHEDYLFKLIRSILRKDFSNNKDEIFLELSAFKYNLINKKLELPFYRDIRSGKYNLMIGKNLLSIDDITEEYRDLLTYDYNLELILELFEKLF